MLHSLLLAQTRPELSRRLLKKFCRAVRLDSSASAGKCSTEANLPSTSHSSALQTKGTHLACHLHSQIEEQTRTEEAMGTHNRAEKVFMAEGETIGLRKLN